MGNCFQNVVSFSNIVPYNCNNFCMKLVEYNEYLVNTLDTLPPVAPFTNMV